MSKKNEKSYVTYFVNLIYFLETAAKTAFLSVETITHFYRKPKQYFKIYVCIIRFCLIKSITVEKFSIFGSPKNCRSCHSCLA